MVNIVVNEKHKTELAATTKMVELYYILNNLKHSQRELEFVAYYVLHGINEVTDQLIISEALMHMEYRMAKQVLANLKSRLKKYQLVTVNERAQYSLIPVLQKKVSADSPINYVVHISVEQP